MKPIKSIGGTGLVPFCLASILLVPSLAFGQAAPAASAAPDLATRVADLEAYVTNSAPKAFLSAGPGHNAWMMTSTALVLFMTLLATNLGDVVGQTLWIELLKAIGLTMILAIAGTVVLTFVVKAVVGLRPDAATEEAGLDDADHGEAGYHFDEVG
jgi:hypothetical protein